MFTGLIKDRGVIKSIVQNDEGRSFEIETSLIDQIGIDDSVAVNGVCLTATHLKEKSFLMQAVHVTLEKTNLGSLVAGDTVNLELALRYSDRLGGHLVQGHVNGVAEVIEISHKGENYHVWYKLPKTLMKYVLKEGSIALDGISLTIADVREDALMVTIIPHTWKETQAQFLKLGSTVNVEVDQMAQMISKYVESFMTQYLEKNNGKI
jgi:riboflavin synthase